MSDNTTGNRKTRKRDKLQDAARAANEEIRKRGIEGVVVKRTGRKLVVKRQRPFNA